MVTCRGPVDFSTGPVAHLEALALYHQSLPHGAVTVVDSRRQRRQLTFSHLQSKVMSIRWSEPLRPFLPQQSKLV